MTLAWPPNAPPTKSEGALMPDWDAKKVAPVMPTFTLLLSNVAWMDPGSAIVNGCVVTVVWERVTAFFAGATFPWVSTQVPLVAPTSTVVSAAASEAKMTQPDAGVVCEVVVLLFTPKTVTERAFDGFVVLVFDGDEQRAAWRVGDDARLGHGRTFAGRERRPGHGGGRLQVVGGPARGRAAGQRFVGRGHVAGGRADREDRAVDGFVLGGARELGQEFGGRHRAQAFLVLLGEDSALGVGALVGAGATGAVEGGERSDRDDARRAAS